ncbi:YihY/virulence factor BrkB family protein [Staphylococcus succinus]|uniref:YihY/virulence factor BrkB family protein n=1 Tax=Staphylococcus succinus TaxID=61015 RepID=A0A9Q6MUA6_9STAP|nr:YihY/virulence factor BrkB family protein [Staphylococcus succinus]MEB8127945.1 YihY/virulence factor BrkB family protein [Staphylococcus succinus]MEB8211312.1 YihY/virulence factor BrkB family protein [Staphylococcus succinus]PTI43716.1 YihY/virulence factor BrkB family protein [Staphylococcus succinus]PTI74189.1 YihY/virulence factor BrkB family protein [Staphylococcus succinus]PTJ19751.1 YihY/virulence factor BrkB family protein [Staphylococcus succinus]
MSKKKRTTSEFLNDVKEEEEKKANQAKKEQIERDRTYITPDEFKSKSPKKSNQAFFVSRINKPAKYTKNSNFFSYLVYRIGKDDASGLSAQLSYYFMLSLFPMLLFLLSIVPVVGVKQSTIRDMIKEHVPPDYAPQVSSIIGDIMGNASGGLLSIGLIVALWSASNGMTALMNSFNVAYDVEDSRNFIVSKLLSVLFTLALIVVLPLALILPTFGEQISSLLFGPIGLGDQVKWVFNIIRVILPLIVVFVAFMLLYTLAPNVKIKMMSVIPGSIFATIVFLVGSYLFGIYISNFANYSKTYGSIAGIIILMLWLYITGFIIIIGAEINAIIHQRKIVSGQTPEEKKLANIEENNSNQQSNSIETDSDNVSDDTIESNNQHN